MLSKTLVLLFAGLVTAELNIEIQKKYEELSSSEFVTYFNGLNLTWSITEYPEQHHFMLGAREEKSRKSLPVVHHEGTLDLPENFDSREKWPHCDSISTIRDQGRCASSWIFAVVDTASDRNCINADIHVLLSQAEGTCMANASVCDGGYPEESFNYWFEKGLVTNQCENYTVNKAMEGQCKTECENPQINYNEDKHFRANVFKVDNHSIRVEIVGYGSVQAMMMVYEDFKQYKGGIYDYKFGKFLGLQAVRIIGYGTEGDVDYWLIANSWGTTWGEKGFVRIKRFTGLRLEDTVLAGMPALF